MRVPFDRCLTGALVALSAFATGAGAQAPPQTDIYVADLSLFDGVYFVGALTNITNRPGHYDNQPAFTADSRSVLYTAAYEDGNDGQTEIHRYYLGSGRDTRVTRTEIESEYSATPIPNDRLISVVRVEPDSTQRLWRFTLEGMDAEVLLPGLAPVGYHAWGNENILALFVLGQPPALRIADLSTGRADVITEGIGRSLHKIPTRNAFSFVEVVSPEESWINELDIGTRETKRLIKTLEGGQDHAWTPDGVLLMAWGPRLYQYNVEIDENWRLIGDYASMELSFSRIAVSPDGTKLAIVGVPVEETGGS